MITKLGKKIASLRCLKYWSLLAIKLHSELVKIFAPFWFVRIYAALQSRSKLSRLTKYQCIVLVLLRKNWETYFHLPLNVLISRFILHLLLISYSPRKFLMELLSWAYDFTLCTNKSSFFCLTNSKFVKQVIHENRQS